MPIQSRYTPEVIAFLQQHWNVDKSAKELALALGVSEQALCRDVSRLRSKGHHFKKKDMPIGAVVHHTEKKRGRTIAKIKTETGWKFLTVVGSKPREAREKKPKKSKPKQVTIQPIPMPRKNTKPASRATQYTTHKNPESVQVKRDREDWRYVKVGKGKWVLRAPENVNA